ncbi:DUF309 domain-containing protein [Streptomyces sp. F63]|nr:DUF309 domain-containing protein [Streptomyces sp. F63]
MREGPDPAVCENCGTPGRARTGAPARLPDPSRGGGGGGGGGAGDDRDRDAEGRARNARPRDGLGRPLPYGAPGVERQPEGVLRTPRRTLEEAQRLLDEGKPFHAHEVLEDAWKAAGERPERPLWRAMAQLAVGMTHAARGNIKGAVALLGRAADGIEPYAAAPPFGVDAAGLTAWARRSAARLSAEGTPPGPAAPPRLRAAGARGETAGARGETTGPAGGTGGAAGAGDIGARG